MQDVTRPRRPRRAAAVTRARRGFAWKNKLSHLGSCPTAAPIINEIFDRKAAEEKFILSTGHAGVALYTILEQRFGLDAQAMFDTHRLRAPKDLPNHVWCSMGYPQWSTAHEALRVSA